MAFRRGFDFDPDGLVPPTPASRPVDLNLIAGALGQEKKRLLLIILRDGPRPVSDIAQQLGMDVPDASRHLGDLEMLGLVATRREGKRRYKRLTPSAAVRLAGHAVCIDIHTSGIDRLSVRYTLRPWLAQRLGLAPHPA